MLNIYKKVGENIRELRKERKLSQEQFAEKVKLDVRTVVAIETGKRNPTLKTMNKIANALSINLKNLF